MDEFVKMKRLGRKDNSPGSVVEVYEDFGNGKLVTKLTKANHSLRRSQDRLGQDRPFAYFHSPLKLKFTYLKKQENKKYREKQIHFNSSKKNLLLNFFEVFFLSFFTIRRNHFQYLFYTGNKPSIFIHKRLT